MSNTTTEITAIIQPVPTPERIVHVLNGGAHRGARENIPTFEEINRRSTGTKVKVTYADPVPGRAEAMLDDPRLERLWARAFEGKVEDLVRVQNAASPDPVVLNLDRASGIAAVYCRWQ